MRPLQAHRKVKQASAVVRLGDAIQERDDFVHFQSLAGRAFFEQAQEFFRTRRRTRTDLFYLVVMRY